MAGAPKENKNAEKWSIEEATDFMSQALELSKKDGYDFIGEVAKKMNSYVDVFDYICDKFPELESYKKHIKRNCEVNCFSSGKKGDIIPSLAIMNLKSNHGWTDRVSATNENVNYNTEITKDEVQSIKDALEDKY